MLFSFFSFFVARFELDEVVVFFFCTQVAVLAPPPHCFPCRFMSFRGTDRSVLVSCCPSAARKRYLSSPPRLDTLCNFLFPPPLSAGACGSYVLFFFFLTPLGPHNDVWDVLCWRPPAPSELTGPPFLFALHLLAKEVDFSFPQFLRAAV